MAYQNSLVLKFNGLYLGPNTLASAPTGALEIADNIDIADDIAYARRGNAAYGNPLNNQAKQLFSYKDRLLVHSGNTLSYDSVKLEITSLTSLGVIATATTSSAHGLTTGQEVTITGCDQVEYNVVNTIVTYITPTSFSYPISNTTVSPATTHSTVYLESGVWTTNVGNITEPVSGAKVKSVELNGNLYLTSSEGIKKLTDPTAALGSAGIPQGLTLIGALNNSPGFFEQDNQVGYVVVWGLKDANKNLLLGTASQVETVTCSAINLFSTDFTELLIKLDNDALAGSLVNPVDFAATLVFNEDASKADVYTNMTALGNKLDLVLKNYGDIASISLSTSVAITNVSGGVNPTITAAGITTVPGEQVKFSGLVTNAALNGYQVVLVGGVGTFTITAAASVAEVPGAATVASLPIITSNAHGLNNLDVINITNTTSTPALSGTFIVRESATNTFKLENSLITTIAQPSANGTWKKNLQFYGTDTGGLMNPVDFPDTVSISDIQDKFEEVLAKLDLDTKIADTNYATSLITTRSQTVDLTIIIPSGITTSHFYQIYRSNLSSGVDITPNADYKQVYEANPLASDLIAGSITIQDITTDIFRSNPLYSNDTQEGSTQTNDIPPFAKDIALYKDSVFYANTSTRHFYEASLLGASNLGSHLSYLNALSIASVANVSGNIWRYTFVGYTYRSLSEIPATDISNKLKVENADDAGNNGTFTIVARDLAGSSIDVINLNGVASGAPNISSACAILGDTITIDTQTYEFRSSVPSADVISMVGSATGGDWFSFYNGDNTRKYVIWYTVAGVGSDPAGETDSIKIKVALAGGHTATAMATATQAAIDSITNDFINITTSVSAPNTQYSVPGLNITIGSTEVWIVPKIAGPNNTVTLTLSGSPSVIRVQTGYIGERATVPTGVITSITAGPQVFSTAHGLLAKDIVTISGSDSIPRIDGTYYVQTAALNSFTIQNGPTIITPGTTGTWTVPKYIGKSIDVSVGNAVTETAKSIVKLLNLDTTNDVIGVYNSSAIDIPGKLLFRRENITDPSFNISSTNAVSFSPDLSTLPIQVSDNEVLGNRIYYSKPLQAEAVPSLNYINIGSRELPIVRILALRDSLFVFKRDGIYRITGDAFSLQVSLFDSSAKLVAPESAVVGNNQIFCFTDQGVVAVSDTGVAIVSGAIEKMLIPFYSQAFLELLSNHTFATFYTTDRKYILWLPEAISDLTATQAYVYNTLNNAWTRYPIAKTCALVNIVDDKLYLGSAEDNYVEQERKSFTYKDQADRRLIRTIVDPNITTNLGITNIAAGKPSIITVNTPHQLVNGDYVVINNSNSVPSINGTYKVFNIKNANQFSITCDRVTTAGTTGSVAKVTKKVQLDDISDIAIGDVLVQPFFLNVNRFNLLLGKLDLDPDLADNDYLDTLKITTRNELSQAIVNLSVKLSADTGTNSIYTASLESEIRKIQYQYNGIIQTLNADTGIDATDYALSDNDLLKQVTIVAIDDVESTVTLAYPGDLSADECFIYKAIVSKVQWIPQHAGDASVDKQYTEAQIMFNELNCSNIELGFKTELSPFVETVSVTGQGSSAFGYSLWGTRPFGLNILSDDLRTLIPSEKQRCRFIIPSTTHSNAYETYGLSGLAIVFRTVAYKVNN